MGSDDWAPLCEHPHSTSRRSCCCSSSSSTAVELHHPSSLPPSHPLCCSLLYPTPVPGNCFLQARPELSSTPCSESASEMEKGPHGSLTSPELQDPSSAGESGKCDGICFILHKPMSWQFFWRKKRVRIEIATACSPNIPLRLTYKVFIWFSSCWGYWNPTGIYIISTSAVTLQSNNLLYSFYISQPSQYVPNAESLKNRGLVNKGYCLLIK